MSEAQSIPGALLQIQEELDSLRAQLAAAEESSAAKDHLLLWEQERSAQIEAERDRAVKDAEALKADMASLYRRVPDLPVTDTEAATDALHGFCLLIGIHNIDAIASAAGEAASG